MRERTALWRSYAAASELPRARPRKPPSRRTASLPKPHRDRTHVGTHQSAHECHIQDGADDGERRKKRGIANLIHRLNRHVRESKNTDFVTEKIGSPFDGRETFDRRLRLVGNRPRLASSLRVRQSTADNAEGDSNETSISINETRNHHCSCWDCGKHGSISLVRSREYANPLGRRDRGDVSRLSGNIFIQLAADQSGRTSQDPSVP